ncbi:cytochrome ubiquinol oxidase subunit I [Desulfoferula mesophila]|uniref:Cytochrome ubiquinol oxidase subunit I n=1 Tax=Desulfoferula mesophila TaxID=3058419 RepID=A0AAU9EFU2_9BACT|nr:cytochrome ubiquinol oxidase subunit I [Desulfoferula mesophilus]
MDLVFDATFLSRLQFALTTMFHILWPLLSIGLSIFLVVLEVLWMRSKNPVYYHHFRFWSLLFLLNFAVGVVSGIPLEFQFGANWERFSVATGGFFGSILGFEATMAFMLEAAFLYLMLFGWKRLPPKAHLFATCMVALGASLSAFWIMVANSWMQTPAGGYFADGKFVTTDYWRAIFNPDLPWGFSHMWVACLETSLFVIGGVSAYYLLRGRHQEFFLKSFKLALLAAVFIAPFQVWLGDGSGRAVAEYQPTKLGAIESTWETNPPGEGAPWHALAWPEPELQRNAWSIDIPYGLSLLITRSFTGQVKGLKEFPRQDQPPVIIPYFAFRVMLGAGFGLVLLMLWTLWAWRKGRLKLSRVAGQKWLLRAWLLAIPAAYAAVETGWIIREVGRQPWVIFGHLRTMNASSLLPASHVAATLAMYLLIYGALLGVFLFFAWRVIKKGPDLSLTPPYYQADGEGKP